MAAKPITKPAIKPAVKTATKPKFKSDAFMPPAVYGLEEYGLARMICRKIHDAGVIDFTDPDLSLHKAINQLRDVSLRGIFRRVPALHEFDVCTLIT